MYNSMLQLLKANRPIGPCVTTHNFNTWFNVGIAALLLTFVLKDTHTLDSLDSSMHWHAISTVGVILLHQLHVREKFVWLVVGLGHNLFELGMGLHMLLGGSVLGVAAIPVILGLWFAFELIVSGNQKTFEDTVDNIFFFSMFAHYPALLMMVASLLFGVDSGHSTEEKMVGLLEHLFHITFELYVFVYLVHARKTVYWRELFVLSNACSCAVVFAYEALGHDAPPAAHV